MTVEEGKPRQKKSMAPQGPNTSIYVKDLPENCEDSVIESAFGGFGTITRVANKSSRGFAFVTFETPEQMNAAIGATGLDVGGNSVTIEEGRRNRGRAPPPAEE